MQTSSPCEERRPSWQSIIGKRPSGGAVSDLSMYNPLDKLGAYALNSAAQGLQASSNQIQY